MQVRWSKMTQITRTFIWSVSPREVSTTSWFAVRELRNSPEISPGTCLFIYRLSFSKLRDCWSQIHDKWCMIGSHSLHPHLFIYLFDKWNVFISLPNQLGPFHLILLQHPHKVNDLFLNHSCYKCDSQGNPVHHLFTSTDNLVDHDNSYSFTGQIFQALKQIILRAITWTLRGWEFQKALPSTSVNRSSVSIGNLCTPGTVLTQNQEHKLCMYYKHTEPIHKIPTSFGLPRLEIRRASPTPHDVHSRMSPPKIRSHKEGPPR